MADQREELERNPLREGVQQARTPDPNCFVIFGASGDLTRRKLLPALFRLYVQGLLPSRFSVVGVARRPLADEEFREQMRQAVATYGALREETAGLWERFSTLLRYVAFEFHDAAGYQRLAQVLAEEDERRGTGGNRLFYLATPPDAFP